MPSNKVYEIKIKARYPDIKYSNMICMLCKYIFNKILY